jgi:uncharacterized protein (DUF2147 family)
MKKFALLAALICTGVVTAGAAGADPIEGMWKTKADDNGHSGYVSVVPCGTKFCGTLVKSFDAAGKEMQSPNIGKQIIWDMVAKGNGAYGDGKVWSPDRDKTYNSKLQLTGDALAVSGCVFVICRDGGTWQRVK